MLKNTKVLVKYVMAGGTALIIHFTILTTLVEIFYVNSIQATTCGFIIASTTNYLLQYHWTFKSSGDHQSTIIRYISLTVCTVFLNMGIFFLLHEIAHIHYFFSQTFASFVIFIVNFFVNQKITFQN